MAVRTKTTKGGLVHYVETRGHWERVGSDKREAERLNQRRKKECRAGTFRPQVTGGITAGRYLETWLDGRTNRAADGDRMMIERHVLPREWFCSTKMEDMTNQLTQRLANEIKAGPPTLKPKYVSNIFGAVRTAFRAALRAGVINREVCLLEPGTLSKKSKEREPYSLAEARALVAAAVGDRLVWLMLAFYTGMRCGEVCGRRWRDWDREALPLGALTIATQYCDQPLKGDDDSTDRPRRAPVHSDLAAVLQWWWDVGFELTYLRKPTQDDFIIERLDAAGECLTRYITYKALERDCAKAEVTRRGQHATRHTFLTQARRASPLAKDLAEKITHNAEGEMVDQYTHWEWDPLCEVVSKLPSLLPRTVADSETASGVASRDPEKTSSDSRTRTRGENETDANGSNGAQPSAFANRRYLARFAVAAAEPCAVSESDPLATAPVWALAFAAHRLGILPAGATLG